MAHKIVGDGGFTPEQEDVKLGRWVYEIREQALPLIEDELGEWFKTITEAGGDPDKLSLGGFVSGKSYSLLQTFIPDLMPWHEFRGYASAEALERDERDPVLRAQAPTGKEVRKALSAGFHVNGIDIWNDVTKLLDPTVAQSILGTAALKLMEKLEDGSLRPSALPTADTDSKTSTDQPSPATDASGGSESTGSESPSPQADGSDSGASQSLEYAHS